MQEREFMKMRKETKVLLERIEIDAKRHINPFCKVEPDQITGKRFAIVYKNSDGDIVYRYTQYYTPKLLYIAVSNYINGLWDAKNIK